jgi:hypothetical protein
MWREVVARVSSVPPSEVKPGSGIAFSTEAGQQRSEVDGEHHAFEH